MAVYEIEQRKVHRGGGRLEDLRVSKISSTKGRSSIGKCNLAAGVVGDLNTRRRNRVEMAGKKYSEKDGKLVL